MKRIAFFSITLLLACMAGCDNKIPMEENLWPETVYLVGAKGVSFTHLTLPKIYPV